MKNVQGEIISSLWRVEMALPLTKTVRNIVMNPCLNLLRPLRPLNTSWRDKTCISYDGRKSHRDAIKALLKEKK